MPLYIILHKYLYLDTNLSPNILISSELFGTLYVKSIVSLEYKFLYNSLISLYFSLINISIAYLSIIPEP